MIKKISLLLILFLFTNLLRAHSLNQINYVFDKDEKGGFLKVHFTPKGAIDLLVTLKPELKDQSTIRLQDYFAEYSEYFNRTIDFKIDEKPLEFEVEKGDLTSHDATLVFRFKNDLTYEGAIDVKVTSFTEILRRIKNYIIVVTPIEKYQCTLTTNNPSCSLNIPKRHTISNTLYIWLIGALLLLVILFVVFKRLGSKK